jgi:pyruvate/2-oxoglutarate dehydrogenase complex dihydrolipoamide acyltransferase (E2) component
MNPPPPPPTEIFGKCVINVWLCALVKGQGKVPYEAGQLDPNTGKELRPLTAIEVAVHKLDEQPDEQPLYRQYIAEFGEWPDLVLPNLREIGLEDLKSLNNSFVHAQLVATGQKYTNKNGEERDSTTFKFLKIFKDEAECRGASQTGATAPAANPAPAAAASDNGNKERETALKFLTPYVRNAVRAGGGDLEKIQASLGTAIAGQALLAKYFTIDSEEVVDLITQELSK